MPRSRACLFLAVLPLGVLPAPASAGGTDRFGEPLPPDAVARIESPHLREPPGGRAVAAAAHIFSVALSSDGKLLLSGASGGPVRAWDAATGDELPPFEGPFSAEQQIAFSPDGKKVVAWTFRQPLRVHDPATGKLLRALEESNEGRSPFFAPDGKTILGFSLTDLLIWDAATGKVLHKYPLKMGSSRAAAFSPDGKVLALGCEDGAVRFMDPATGQETAKLAAHESHVGALAYSAGGKVLATHGWGQSLCLWDAATRKRFLEVPKVYSQGNMAFTPDGKYLVTGENGGVCLRDAHTGKELGRTNSYWTASYSLAVTPDGKTVFWAQQDVRVRMARILDGRLREVEPEALLPLGVAFTADGKGVMTAGAGRVSFWDAATGKERRRLPDVPGLAAAALAPDGKALAVADPAGVSLLDPATGKERRRLRTERRPSAVAVAPDGKRVAAAEGRGVRVWPAEGGDGVTCRGHTGTVAAAAFRPDGKLLVTGGEDATVILWDAATGAERGRLPKQAAAVGCVAVSSDGKTIATGDWEGHVRLWSVADDKGGLTASELAAPERHDDNVAAVAFSPDGRLLASAGWDGVVRVWDVKLAKRRLELKGHRDEVASLAFSPDGKRLASGSRDHTVLIWDVTGR